MNKLQIIEHTSNGRNVQDFAKIGDAQRAFNAAAKVDGADVVLYSVKHDGSKVVAKPLEFTIAWCVRQEITCPKKLRAAKRAEQEARNAA